MTFSRAAAVNTEVGAGPGRFGYMAAILYNTDLYQAYHCGGALIAPNVVLTSARCSTGNPMDFSDYVVLLGCADNADRSNCEVTQIQRIVVFPSFAQQPLMSGGDVKLLILERNSQYNPVGIAAPGFGLAAGQDLTVLGWDDVSLRDGDLVETDVEVVSQDSCEDQYRDVTEIKEGFPSEVINDFSFCIQAREQESVTNCYSEVGYPTIQRCDSTGDDVLVGVGSFQVGCDVDGIPRVNTALFHPEVFAFIEEVVAGKGHQLNTIPKSDQFCQQQPEALPDPPTPFPTFDVDAWTCGVDSFASQDGCHCNCGIPDPDCSTGTQATFGCSSGQICDEGLCVARSEETKGTESEGLFEEFFSLNNVLGSVALMAMLVYGSVFAYKQARSWFKTSENLTIKGEPVTHYQLE